MKNILSTAALLGISAAASAGQFSGCLDMFPKQTPPVVQHPGGVTRDLCFDAFAVLHSGESKTPVYVVEKLNKARLIDAKDEVRTNKFYEEARLPSRERSRLDDYKGSGYDRGHQAPAGDMPTATAMAQSFSLANMVPQAPENNRGVWAKRVERTTRQYVMKAAGDVFVFTGPVFSNVPTLKIGAGNVWVPSHLYKLVYDPSTNRAWAYWVENLDTADVREPISYDELVQRVGITFLPGIRPSR